MGGAVYLNELIAAQFDNNIFQGCRASSTGGAAFLNANVEKSMFYQNAFHNCSSVVEGGSLYFSAAIEGIVLHDTTIIGSSSSSGAGIFLDGGTEGIAQIEIDNLTAINCKASRSGSGIYVNELISNFTLKNSKFQFQSFCSTEKSRICV